ncbi:MAG: hypothetical protein JXR91_04780 [Deltaproteobacteria bacterium]|nr:hypothetical protein [Deltaproteobacteria bacterium]
MKKTIKTNFTIMILLSLFQYVCGEHGDAIAALTMAGTLQLIQEVRTDHSKQRAACNEFCRDGEFPCGDFCVSNGSLCYRPPGSACQYSKSPAPKTDEAPPAGTITAPGSPYFIITP